MPKSITVVKRLNQDNTITGNVLLEVEATVGNSMSKAVFVKKRMITSDNKFNDVFVIQFS